MYARLKPTVDFSVSFELVLWSKEQDIDLRREELGAVCNTDRESHVCQAFYPDIYSSLSTGLAWQVFLFKSMYSPS